MQQFQNLCHNVSFPFIIIALSKYFKYPLITAGNMQKTDKYKVRNTAALFYSA